MILRIYSSTVNNANVYQLKQLEHFVIFVFIAERMGFEPTVHRNVVHSHPKRAPSTARATSPYKQKGQCYGTALQFCVASQKNSSLRFCFNAYV